MLGANQITRFSVYLICASMCVRTPLRTKLLQSAKWSTHRFRMNWQVVHSGIPYLGVCTIVSTTCCGFALFCTFFRGLAWGMHTCWGVRSLTIEYSYSQSGAPDLTSRSNRIGEGVSPHWINCTGYQIDTKARSC